MSLKQKTLEIIIPESDFLDAQSQLSDGLDSPEEANLLADILVSEIDSRTQRDESIEKAMEIASPKTTESMKSRQDAIDEAIEATRPQRRVDLVSMALLGTIGSIAIEPAQEPGFLRIWRKEDVTEKDKPEMEVAKQIASLIGSYRSADETYHDKSILREARKSALNRKNSILSNTVGLLRSLGVTKRDQAIDLFVKEVKSGRAWAKPGFQGSLSSFINGASREVVGGDALESIAEQLSSLTNETWSIRQSDVEEDTADGFDYVISTGEGDSARSYEFDIKGRKPARSDEPLKDVRKYSSIKKGEVIVLYVEGRNGDKCISEKRKIVLSKNKRNPSSLEAVSCDTSSMSERDEYKDMSDEIIQRIMTKEVLRLSR